MSFFDSASGSPDSSFCKELPAFESDKKGFICLTFHLWRRRCWNCRLLWFLLLFFNFDFFLFIFCLWLDNSLHDLLLNGLVVHAKPLNCEFNQVITFCFQNEMLVHSAQIFKFTLELWICTSLIFSALKWNVWIIIIHIWFLNILKIVDCDVLVGIDNPFGIQMKFMICVIWDLGLGT